MVKKREKPMADHQMRLDGGADPVAPKRAEQFHIAAGGKPEPAPIASAESPWVRAENRQPALFLTPREIYHSLGMADQTPRVSRRDLMASKYREATAPSLVSGESLKENMSKQQFASPRPVTVDWGEDVSTLANGHHRLAVALKHAPDTPMPLLSGSTWEYDSRAPGAREPDSQYVDYTAMVPKDHPDADFSHLPEDPSEPIRSAVSKQQFQKVAGDLNSGDQLPSSVLRELESGSFSDAPAARWTAGSIYRRAMGLPRK